MKKKQNERINYIVPFLFLIYLVLLVWIVLFKLQFSISEIDAIRQINLIPFHYDNEIRIELHLKEVLENVAIFIPFGIYLSMLSDARYLKAMVFLISVVSLVLEVVQYILAIGQTDITDLLTNTCGGALGIFLYWLSKKIFRSKRHADLVLTIMAAIVTIVVGGMLIILLIANGGR